MQDHLNPEPRIWKLITRKLSGEITGDQLAELDSWQREHPERQKFLAELALLWDSADHSDIETPTESMAWKRLEDRLVRQADDNDQHTGETIELSQYFKWVVVAAFLLFTAVAGIYWIMSTSGNDGPSDQSTFDLQSGSSQVLNEDIVLSSDSLDHLRLPDGSWVWLNDSTQITYSPSFGINTREVELTGEAYFEVRTDQRIPFVINSAQTQTRVLGTTFNLKAYDNKPVELSVVEGTVTFSENNTSADMDTMLVLRTGEYAIWSRESGGIRKRLRGDDHFLDWKHILEYREEISSPADFMTGNWRSKVNDLDHTEIEGVIHNHAKLATYQGIKLGIQYYHKKKERVITYEFVVDQSVPPGETIDYRYSLTDQSSQIGEIQIKIIDANINYK